LKKWKKAEDKEQFSYIPVQLIQDTTDDDDDDENFDDANEIPIQSITKPTTDSSIVNKLIPPVNSDRSRSQSPKNNFFLSNKPTSVSSNSRGPSKASSIISTAATAGSGRQTSLSDLDKELQEFDIDLDRDDVSDTENRSSIRKGTFKKSTDENEDLQFDDDDDMDEFLKDTWNIYQVVYRISNIYVHW